MSDPPAPVQAQLDAYNRREIDPFVACYTEDVRVYDLVTGALKLEGIAAFHEAYARQFAEAPEKRAWLLNRHVAGPLVLDTEHVHDPEHHEPFRVLAVYEVRGDRIAQVWFGPRY